MHNLTFSHTTHTGPVWQPLEILAGMFPHIEILPVAMHMETAHTLEGVTFEAYKNADTRRTFLVGPEIVAHYDWSRDADGKAAVVPFLSVADALDWWTA